MRPCTLLLVIAACAKTPTPTRGPAARCLPITDANAEASRAGERNDRRFRDELAKKGVQIVAFAKAGADRGDQTEVTFEMRDGRRLLVVPSSTCASETTQLAKNAQNELFSLAIHRRGTNASIVACDCRPESSGASCGGAHVAPIKDLYVVPDELTYKGSLEIEYEVEPATLLFSGRRPDGGDCPPPPPPPP